MNNFFASFFDKVTDSVIVFKQSSELVEYYNSAFKDCREDVMLTVTGNITLSDLFDKDTVKNLVSIRQNNCDNNAEIPLTLKNHTDIILSRISFYPDNEFDSIILFFEKERSDNLAYFEEEIRDSIFVDLFDSLPLINWICDKDGVVSYISGMGLNKININPEDCIGTPITEVFFQSRQLAGDLQIVFTGKAYNSIIKLQGKSYQARYEPVFDSEHNVQGIFGSFIDISSKSQTAGKLLSNEILLETVFRTLKVSLAIINEHGKIDFTNIDMKVNGDYISYPTPLLPGTNILVEFIKAARKGDKFASIIEKKLNQLYLNEKSEFTFHYPGLLHENGIWLIIKGNKISFYGEKIVLSFITINDIYDISRDLKRIETHYIELLENHTDGVFSLSIDGSIISINKAFESFSGWKREDILGKSFMELIYAADIGVGYSMFKKMIDGETPPPYELRMLGPSGGYNIAQLNAKPILDNGKVTGIIGIAHNITELRKTERALVKSEEQYRSVVNYQSELICRFLSDFTLTFVNDAFCRYYGKAREDLLESSLLKLSHSDDIVAIKEKYKALIAGKTKVTSEHRSYTAEGELRWQRWVELPIFGTNNSFIEFQSIGVDITELKLAEDALRKSEERFRAIIENVSEIVMLYNAEGHLIYVSQSVKTILGYEADELLEQTVAFDILHPEDEEKLISAFAEIVNNPTKETPFEVRFKHKNGSWKTLEGSGVNKLGHQHLKAIIVLCHDITERRISEEIRKELESELTKLSLVARQTTSSIVITNLDHGIVWANRAFSKLTGYSFEEAQGRKTDDLLYGPYTDSSVVEFYKEKVETGESIKTRIFIYTKDRDGVWTELLIDPMFNSEGDQIGYIRVQNDISELVTQEWALREAKDRAEEMNRIKSNFLANMSHELRTPMIGVLGYAEMLFEDIEDDEQKKMAEVIFNSGKRLLETLNLLLDLSKIEANKLQVSITPFNPDKLVDAVIKQFNGEANKKQLTIKKVCCFDKYTVFLDEKLFKEIVSNVVNNAIKFTREGGVTISLIIQERDNQEWLIIKVDDTGIGIPPESRELIFEEFRQVSEGLNRNFEGTGLGLTITKKIVESLHGRIYIEPKETRGSVFVVEFPAQYAKEQIIVNNIEPDVLKKKKIIPRREYDHSLPEALLVENDPISRKITRMFLEPICNLETCDSGEDAVELAKQKSYKLILMDINLGNGLNGVQATKEIRKIDGYEKTPIIAVTAFAMKGDKEEFISGGCTDYLSKPFNRISLLQFVGKYLNIEVSNQLLSLP